MSATNRLYWVLLALLLFCGTACDPMKHPPGSQAELLPKDQYQRIQAVDKLEPWLFFGEALVTASGPNQPMVVEVPVRDKAEEPLNVQYRFEFYDKDGRLLTRTESWRFMTLSPRLEYRFKGMGVDPASADWRMVVRPAQ